MLLLEAEWRGFVSLNKDQVGRSACGFQIKLKHSVFFFFLLGGLLGGQIMGKRGKRRGEKGDVTHVYTDLERCPVEWCLILPMPPTRNVNCRPD